MSSSPSFAFRWRKFHVRCIVKSCACNDVYQISKHYIYLHIIVLWMHSVQWQNGQWTHLACFWLYRSGIEWRQRLDFRSSLGLEHVENNHSGTWVPDFLKINLWQWIWRRTYREVPWRKFVKGKSTDQQMRELIQLAVFRQTPFLMDFIHSRVAKNCRLVQRSAKSALDSMTLLMLSSMPYGEITKQTSTTSLWTNETIYETT